MESPKQFTAKNGKRIFYTGNKTDNAKFVEIIRNRQIVHTNIKIIGPIHTSIPAKHTKHHRYYRETLNLQLAGISYYDQLDNKQPTS